MDKAEMQQWVNKIKNRYTERETWLGFCDWLVSQDLMPLAERIYTYLQTPRKVLDDYLKDATLKVQIATHYHGCYFGGNNSRGIVFYCRFGPEGDAYFDYDDEPRCLYFLSMCICAAFPEFDPQQSAPD